MITGLVFGAGIALEDIVATRDNDGNIVLSIRDTDDRITLTLPTLRNAGEVLFLVAGESKADAARRAFAGEPSRSTPGSLVRAEHGPTTAVLDVGAAAKL